MSIQSRDNLKQWFRTRDKPTQQQFWDWLDSFIHKLEGIAIGDVSGLTTQLNNKIDIGQLSNYITIAEGMVEISSVGAFVTMSKAQARFVILKNIGIFSILETADLANNNTTFNSAEPGWLWNMILEIGGGSGGGILADKFVMNADYVYQLDDGFSVDKIKMMPTVAQALKIGLTIGGEEIMFEEMIAGGDVYTVSMDVDAFGENVSIYFTGATDDVSVTIYKREL